MPSQFALPQRINFARAGTVRAYFLRPILKLVMCTVSPLFPSFTQLRQATLALLLAGLALKAVGALDLLKQMSWIEAYVILNLATFAGLYLLGWCIGRLCNSVLPPEA